MLANKAGTMTYCPQTSLRHHRRWHYMGCRANRPRPRASTVCANVGRVAPEPRANNQSASGLEQRRLA